MLNSSLGVMVLQELIVPFTEDLQCFAELLWFNVAMQSR